MAHLEILAPRSNEVRMIYLPVPLAAIHRVWEVIRRFRNVEPRELRPGLAPVNEVAIQQIERHHQDTRSWFVSLPVSCRKRAGTLIVLFLFYLNTIG
jgi:hypothetical protein